MSNHFNQPLQPTTSTNHFNQPLQPITAYPPNNEHYTTYSCWI